MKKKSVIITPINPEGKTNEDTKKILFGKVKPSDLGIKPDRIARSRKTGVRIEASGVDPSMINKEALKAAGLKPDIQDNVKPRLAIFGVETGIDDVKLKKQHFRVSERRLYQ